MCEDLHAMITLLILIEVIKMHWYTIKKAYAGHLELYDNFYGFHKKILSFKSRVYIIEKIKIGI